MNPVRPYKEDIFLRGRYSKTEKAKPYIGDKLRKGLTG
jgi:hypothetical protein